MSWLSKAVCRKDKHAEYWTSYNLEKIEYAKSGCDRCDVQRECRMNALSLNDEPVGVIAGISEYERRLLLWKEEDQDNGFEW